jgi:hypothetical protein
LVDNDSWERSHTSACGNVTITLGSGPTPTVYLAKGAVQMFMRDLAELVTETARAAADAAHAASEAEPDPEPSIDEAIAELTGLRDGFRDNGPEATIERQRSRMGFEDEPGAGERDALVGKASLAMPESVVNYLSSSIQLLERFRDAPPGTGKRGEEELPLGKATSPSKLVTVESSLQYPIASVWLSKRAGEVGPKVLAAELTETAAAAAADLATSQSEFYKDIGVPVSPEQINALPERVEQGGKQALADFKQFENQHQDFTRRLNEGGYFA